MRLQRYRVLEDGPEKKDEPPKEKRKLSKPKAEEIRLEKSKSSEHLELVQFARDNVEPPILYSCPTARIVPDFGFEGPVRGTF